MALNRDLNAETWAPCEMQPPLWEDARNACMARSPNWGRKLLGPGDMIGATTWRGILKAIEELGRGRREGGR
jgi:hypothetical protein